MEDDIKNYLPAVVFRGTPCTVYNVHAFNDALLCNNPGSDKQNS